jgi:peptidoglycan/LPS O-acetylase OafA/YrhL
MKRLECLDGLRGMLALYVLLGHMAPYAVLPSVVASSVSHGAAAVDLFFALSGLVIAQSLDRFAGQPGQFLMARIARLFPVFLAVFAAALLVQPLSCRFEVMPWLPWTSPARSICVEGWPSRWLPEILAHLTMTHGLFPWAILPDAWVSFLGSAWSLSAEWQFYFIALLTPRRYLVSVLVLLACAGTVWQAAGPTEWQFSRAFLPNQAHYFALGVASVAVVRRQSRALLMYGLMLAFVLMTCLLSGPPVKALPPLVWTWCLAVQLCTRPRVLLVFANVLRSRICLWLGAISYCVYLVNEPIHKVAAGVLAGLVHGNGTLFTMVWIPAAVGLPVLVSAGLHVWLEQPALRRLRAWRLPPNVVPEAAAGD